MKGFYLKKVKPNLKNIKMMALSGAGIEEISKKIGVSVKTMEKYRKEFAELEDALNEKKNSDALVMEAFFKRACGYTYEEETTEFKGKKSPDGEMLDEQVVTKKTRKDVPPDLNAIKWWLEKNKNTDEPEIEISLEEARKLIDEQRQQFEGI